MQARYVILRVLLECENLVSIEQITNSEDGKPDLLVHLERTRIESVGKPAIGKFLNKLQVRNHHSPVFDSLPFLLIRCTGLQLMSLLVRPSTLTIPVLRRITLL